MIAVARSQAALIILLLLILPSLAVCADETSAETEITQEQSARQDAQKSAQQLSQQNTQQNTLPEEKRKYPFLTNQLFTNTSNKPVKKEISANDSALTVTLGLIVILVMIFSLAWFMKKMGYSNATGQGQLKIIASLNLGQKEKIALIQVGKQQLLVGMTATQINTLHVLDEVLEETNIKQSGGTTADGAFASKFTEFLKHK